MTAGPVTSRPPVDPGIAQRQLGEGATESGEGGESFADLLAAMLAPGAVQLNEPLTVEHGTPEAVFDRLDSAEIFNETGLFRGAAPLATSPLESGAGSPPIAESPEPLSAGAVEIEPSSPPGAAPASADAEPGLAPATAGRFAFEGPLTSSPASGSPASSAGAARSGPALRGHPVAVPMSPLQAAEAAPPEVAGTGRASSRTAAMLVQAQLAKAASPSAQVSVQAVEGGISLVARADKLSREERDRLRMEIAELLSRHGFAIVEMTLNGEAWPVPQRKDD